MDATQAQVQAELGRAVARAQQHLAESDVDGLLADLRELQHPVLLSGPPAWSAWHQATQEVLQFLFSRLPLEQFLDLPLGENLDKWDLCNALENTSEPLTAEQLIAVADRFEWSPGEHQLPRLFATLADCPDESVTAWFQALIERRLPAEADDGTELSHHFKLMSRFQTIGWQPDDKGLSDAVGILAWRRDPLALRLTEEYLLTLPWGQDRRASAALIQALAEESSESSRTLLARALLHHTTPSPLRQLLLNAHGTFDAPDALRLCRCKTWPVSTPRSRVRAT